MFKLKNKITKITMKTKISSIKNKRTKVIDFKKLG